MLTHRLNFSLSALFCISLLIIPLFSQTPSNTYRSEIASAGKEVIETERVIIKKMDLGAGGTGENKFTASVKNKTNSALKIVLDLRADPGFWLRKSQNQFLFEFKPHEEKRIEANYQFSRMSAEAWLRVRFGDPAFFEKKYYLGQGNKAVDYDLSDFETHQTAHFDIYYFKNSLAAKNINAIATERDAAFKSIADLLDVNYSGRVRIFFFPDAESKKEETGHTGDGWAFSNNIVEIYNEKTQLDPFHELAHIISGQVGSPPAMFDEGFAVYVSEKLGTDALKYLAHGRKTVDEVVREYFEKGQLIPIEELFGYTEIGSQKSKPMIAYPQAGSIMKYLVEAQGLSKIRKAFEKLRTSSDSQVIEQNKKAFAEIYGQSLAEIERNWIEKIAIGNEN